MTLEQLEGYSKDWIVNEIENGGRFVVFPYCISALIISFQKYSKVYFIRNDEWAIKYGWMYMLISLVLGWWGFPWGFIYTIRSFFQCFRGKNCTVEVVVQDPYLASCLIPVQMEEAQPLPNNDDTPELPPIPGNPSSNQIG